MKAATSTRHQPNIFWPNWSTVIYKSWSKSTYKQTVKSKTDLTPNKQNIPARMSCSIHVREYCAQAPPQEMSPRLKSVPTSRSRRRSSCCSDTTSHRWIVGLVALAILARTWGVKNNNWVIMDIQRLQHLRSLHHVSPCKQRAAGQRGRWSPWKGGTGPVSAPQRCSIHGTG